MTPRDVTRARLLVTLIQRIVDELTPLLANIDARETRLDPHLRKGFRRKKSDSKRSSSKKAASKSKKATRRSRS